jgi:dihydrofolate synthase / folylpolyglutamate synthase
MNLVPIKTHRVEVGEKLFPLLDRYVEDLQEKSILAITSKILSLCEGRIICKNKVASKEQLIKQESDQYLDSDAIDRFGVLLTIKNNILIPSAGIDESNGPEVYILYPNDVFKTARVIWRYLRKRDRIKQLGIVITDSHSTPLRKGVMGIGLAWCGFLALRDYVGKQDLFGRPLRITQANILDGLAASSVFLMGEGSEQTPMVLIQGAPGINFQQRPPIQSEIDAIRIPLEDDLYGPILQNGNWQSSTFRKQ